MQYYNLGAKHPDLIEKRRRAFADNLRRYARPEAGAAGGGRETGTATSAADSAKPDAEASGSGGGVTRRSGHSGPAG